MLILGITKQGEPRLSKSLSDLWSDHNSYFLPEEVIVYVLSQFLFFFIAAYQFTLYLGIALYLGG